MSTIEAVEFRKRDFSVDVVMDGIDAKSLEALAQAICRARPSRLDNVLELEIRHRADSPIAQMIQLACDNGMRSIVLKTTEPSWSPNVADPRAYMTFEYETGLVRDQWTEMSRCDDADDYMVDVLKVSFAKKVVTNCINDAGVCPNLVLLRGGLALTPSE